VQTCRSETGFERTTGFEPATPTFGKDIKHILSRPESSYAVLPALVSRTLRDAAGLSGTA
jgi:hypothetical protein